MILKIQITLLILSLNFLSYSTNLYIKTNTAECINCYAGFSLLNKINLNINLYLVFKESVRTPNRFIKKYLPDINHNYSIIINDSIYNSLNHSFDSECYVTNIFNDSLLSFKLKELNYYLDTINSVKTGIEILNQNSLPDKIYFPRGAKLSTYKDQVILYESGGKVFYFLDTINYSVINQTSLSRFDSIIHNTILSKEELLIYNKNKSFVANFGNVYPVINSIKTKAEQIFVFCSVPFFTENSKDGILVKTKRIIIMFNNDIIKIFNIQDPPAPYFHLPHRMDIVNNDIVLPIRKDTLIEPIYFLAKFKFNNDSLLFNDFVYKEIPDFYKDNDLFYDLLAYFYFENNIFFNYSNTLYNTENNSISYLPFSNDNFSYNRTTYKRIYSYVLISVFKNNNIVLLHKDFNKNYYISTLDSNSYEVINTEKIDFIKGRLLTNIIQLENNKFLVINDDNKVIEFEFN